MIAANSLDNPKLRDYFFLTDFLTGLLAVFLAPTSSWCMQLTGQLFSASSLQPSDWTCVFTGFAFVRSAFQAQLLHSVMHKPQPMHTSMSFHIL